MMLSDTQRRAMFARMSSVRAAVHNGQRRLAVTAYRHPFAREALFAAANTAAQIGIRGRLQDFVTAKTGYRPGVIGRMVSGMAVGAAVDKAEAGVRRLMFGNAKFRVTKMGQYGQNVGTLGVVLAHEAPVAYGAAKSLAGKLRAKAKARRSEADTRGWPNAAIRRYVMRGDRVSMPPGMRPLPWPPQPLG